MQSLAHALLLSPLILAALGYAAEPVILSAGGTRVQLDAGAGGVPSSVWFDLNRDQHFSPDELLLDRGPGQGLVLELESPGANPRLSWSEGRLHRLRAVADSIVLESPNHAVVLGKFYWAGSWPYRLDWWITGGGVIRGSFQLLPGRIELHPSPIVSLGLDLRFHYRNADSFRRRAIHTAVDQRIAELPAEIVRWWSGRLEYDMKPAVYGYAREAEAPWPDYNLVTLEQTGPRDCRVWKAIDNASSSLTDWRGAQSRGWMHIEDRLWGLGYGLEGMAAQAPSALEANLDTGDSTASVSIRFWPRSAHRLDPRDATRAATAYKFFLVPNDGRWRDERAPSLDALASQDATPTNQEPNPNQFAYQPPQKQAPVSPSGASFRIDEPAGVDRRDWPVTVGVPLRRGTVTSVKDLRLSTSGHGRPFQAEPLAYWPDRSIKWVLLDLQTDLPKSQGSLYTLEKGPAATAPSKPLATQTPTGVRVDTGTLAFEVDRNGTGMVDRAWLDLNHDGQYQPGELVVGTTGGRRSILDFVRSDDYRTGDHDIRGTLDASTLRLASVAIETNGPFRAVIIIRGDCANGRPSPFTLRLEAYAGKSWIRAQHTFTLTLDPDRHFLTATGLRLPLTMQGPAKASIGGLASGQVDIAEATQEGLNHAVVNAVDPVTGAVRNLSETASLPGWVDLTGDRWGVTVAVQNFREEFAKGLAVDALHKEITAWFWPPSAPPLDLRRYSRWTYPQVGETNPSVKSFDLRSVGNATGFSKTSSAVIAFHTGPVTEADQLTAGFQSRPVAICNPDYYSELGLTTGIPASKPGQFPQLERTITDSDDWFLFNRARFSWYGLVDYGDIGHMSRPAFQYDEDGKFHFRDGWAYDIGRWGWTNTEGQDALSYFLSFFHTGYRPYFDAGAIAAAHNRDVDIFHWGPERYQGHTRHNVNHWGDADTEIRISQPSPTRFQYYLTGDPRTREIITNVVEELFANYSLRQSADLGAVLYGCLVRWEMTGDTRWRDKALAIAHSYGRLMSEDGNLPESGFLIEASTGQGTRTAHLNFAEKGPFFLHAFGAMHAFIELAELTGDQELATMLHRHAVRCSLHPPGTDPFLLLLSYEYGKTGEPRFWERIRSTLNAVGLGRGIYPRDRTKWTGSWGSGVRDTTPWLVRGSVENVHEIYTPLTMFSVVPLLNVIDSLGRRNHAESEIGFK
ncbi:hypothetical protein [uncultured Paludibaculum sp.]|uniref:exo-rhamnogalacturonan lyase family protein n=1 Tax=uncultured Paludibaculum sp. TaxID=1765020 RepID=UPI002AAC40FA|nr:hypothetical protein [uncultured Paludibaculum sp.]